MSLEVFFTRSAIKDLSQIERKDALVIKDKILSLSNNPTPNGYKKLEGRDGYRIRTGRYRIIYESDFKSFINILHIGHRKDIYR